MIQSMTGFGKAGAEKFNMSVEVEIKSVNSRYLEIFVKLPPILSDREYEIREVLRSKINRGKINVVVQLKRNGTNDLSGINETRLKSYIDLVNKIKKTAKLKDELKLEHILSNKDIISASENTLTDNEFNFVKNVLGQAIDSLNSMRKNEGKELAKDLARRIKSIETMVNSIEKKYKGTVNSHFNKLKERISVLTKDTETDEQRLNLELAIMADKADITEECVRLKSHLKFFIDSIDKQADPGRKLNFLCQELNRETNTISSKSISTFITHKTILIKEEIEKIREQIQNIE
jgi:uncharacterized protein (TIGR00255 family)